MDTKPPHADLEAGLTRAREVLTSRFGHQNFLPGQEAAMSSILARRNLLVVMPTGSGKSLLYQLPALLEPGLTLVVSPLIALMKDQVDELRRKGIAATFVNSSLPSDEQRGRMLACVQGEYALLYVAPERFRNSAFMGLLGRIQVARMAVDEAHCISEWGHDFRPDYRRLHEARERMGRPLVTALTATATGRVQRDIVASLGFAPAEVDVHVHGFDRPNLKLRKVEVFSEAEKHEFLEGFLQDHPGSGIIYTGTRKNAEAVAAALAGVEKRTAVYHAGLEATDRTRAQEAFLSGAARVVMATSAFGMGIDKPDVRFVIHYNYPGSLEQYYQEIGRAGRDGLPSDCVLLHMPADHFLREFFIDLNYPSRDEVHEVYDTIFSVPQNPVMLTYAQLAELCPDKVKEGQVGAAVRLLDEAGVTRALAGEPKISLTFDEPGAAIISKVRGAVQRRVVEALAATVDLEEPGRFELGISELTRAAGLAEDQVRRTLAALHASGLVKYEPAFRGRGIEKLADPRPAFGKLAIDWKHYEMLRGLEEEKLAGMEDYIRAPGCRRAHILRYFGERESFACGTCDNCLAQGGGVKQGGGDALTKNPQVALPVLICVQHLRFPLGKNRIAQVVTGSRNLEILTWGLDRNPAYGRVTAKREAVLIAIDDLTRAGYLARQGEAGRPVLELTDRGREALKGRSLDDLAALPAARATPMAISPSAPDRESRVMPHESGDADIRLAALTCVDTLRAPVGATKVAAILGGSRAQWVAPLGADALAVYGAVHSTQEHIREVVADLVKQKLLKKTGDLKYPVLQLTEAGRKEMAAGAAKNLPAEKMESPREPEEMSEDVAPEDPQVPPGGATALIETMLDKLLSTEPATAKALLSELRLFHPGEIMARLEARFKNARAEREQARAIWAAGELGGAHGLEFLFNCAVAEGSNLRRLAASALGKVAQTEKKLTLGDHRKRARAMLQRLADDPAPQVRQYAEKALEQFSAAGRADDEEA